MLSLKKPSAESVRQFLAEQATCDFTYAAVGATAHTPPSGYVADHTRIKLGEGERAFQAARAALQRWQQLQLNWLEALPADTPIRAGEVVAVLGRVVGVWSLNACRIVYVVDDSGLSSRFGFAYGTLPAHMERGEERFLVEWNQSDNAVWYDVLAFSRPNHFLTRLGYPIVRRVQKRFARNSAAAMIKAVRSIDGVA